MSVERTGFRTAMEGALLWMLTVGTGLSAPVEIETLGPTLNVERYVAGARDVFRVKQPRLDPSRIRIERPTGHDANDRRFPVSTKRMRPGRVVSQRMVWRGDFRPLCIVGNDPLSFSWARERSAQLRAIGATCMMVEAHHEREVNTMRKVLSGVPLIAVPGDVLAQTHGLTHYPILLTVGAIEQ